MKQFKVALPPDLRARLEIASSKSGRSLADEIRVRVEASFAQETVDKPTRDFLDDVVTIAVETELEMGGAWHKDASAHFVFGEVILNRLERFKPKGPIKLPADAERPQATITPGGTKKDAKNLLEILARGIEFQIHRYGPGFSKSELRQGLVEGRRRVMAAGFTITEDESAKGRPFDPLAEQAKFDQQRKKGEKS